MIFPAEASLKMSRVVAMFIPSRKSVATSKIVGKVLISNGDVMYTTTIKMSTDNAMLRPRMIQEECR
jgi:hypothetical protein